jgi:glycosyltransferase involved in cell wall biosynthesis
MPVPSPDDFAHPRDPPFLSIVIPVLEPDAELDRCLHCILGAFIGARTPEVVVVTPPRFIAQIERVFAWVRVCAETRKGIYGAMNDGARASRGQYVYFLGKDDIVLPGLREAVTLLERDRPFALFCDVYWGSRGLSRGTPSRLGLLAGNLCHQGILYSRQAFERHGPYVRRMRVQADHLLNIKILWDRESGSRVQYLDAPVAWYSGDGFSEINRDPVFWRLYPNVLHRYVGAWAACLLNLYRRLRGV